MLTPETGFNIIPPEVAWQIVKHLWLEVAISCTLVVALPHWLAQWKRSYSSSEQT